MDDYAERRRNLHTALATRMRAYAADFSPMAAERYWQANSTVVGSARRSCRNVPSLDVAARIQAPGTTGMW